MFSLFSAFRLKMLKLLRKLLLLPHPAVRQNCLESCSVARTRFLSTITAGLFIISISSIFVITQMIIKFRSWLSAMRVKYHFVSNLVPRVSPLALRGAGRGETLEMRLLHKGFDLYPGSFRLKTGPQINARSKTDLNKYRVYGRCEIGALCTRFVGFKIVMSFF